MCIFEVLPNYNKNEIKNAVEGIYGVNVLSVNIIKIPAKKRRLGMTQGFRKAYKKAVVKIKNGQKIEIL
jgi:large subunit ribosomal protein L23